MLTALLCLAAALYALPFAAIVVARLLDPPEDRRVWAAGELGGRDE